jgi:hypothetical protein
VLGLYGAVRGHSIAEDDTVYLRDEPFKAELHRYLINRFELDGNSLKPLVHIALDKTLFPT